ncbi:hypothetical protein DFH06DRAFT_1127059 [Mycena polygramma]|nr:hypothetical protein DFH06DRAFT_1127059 [Mycena polygramma]
MNPKKRKIAQMRPVRYKVKQTVQRHAGGGRVATLAISHVRQFPNTAARPHILAFTVHPWLAAVWDIRLKSFVSLKLSAPPPITTAIEKSATQRRGLGWLPFELAKPPCPRISRRPVLRLGERRPRSTARKMPGFSHREPATLARVRALNASASFGAGIVRLRLRLERLRLAVKPCGLFPPPPPSDVNISTGDLQVGERYANLDTIFYRAFAQSPNSCPFRNGVDTERVEQNWAYQNHQGLQSMSPGQRHASLEGAHEFHQWRFHGRGQAAALQHKKHRLLRAIRMDPHCALDSLSTTISVMDATQSTATSGSKDSTPDFSGKQFYTPAKADDGYQACGIPFLPGSRFKSHEWASSDGRTHYNLVYGGPDAAVALYTPGYAFGASAAISLRSCSVREAYTLAMRLTDNPADTRAGATKLYLATGPTLGEKSGGYNSWNSANSVISGARGATAPGYKNWRDLVTAWQGGCDRGEHDHALRAAPNQYHLGPQNVTRHTPFWGARPSIWRACTPLIQARAVEEKFHNISNINSTHSRMVG